MQDSRTVRKSSRRARWLALVPLAASLLLTLDARAAEPRRLALVLGNAQYRYTTPLGNALNDSHDMAAALRGLKFDVVDEADSSLTSLDAALKAFAAKIAPGDTVVVYYAGHGVMGLAAADNAALDNFIVPIDARFGGPDKVSQESLAVTKVLQALERANAGPRLLILDSCRANPFAEAWAADATPKGGVTGLGLVQPPTSVLRNVYIAFATSPGKWADDNRGQRNGLFTQEVLKRINTPGLTVNALFEQVSASVELLSRGEQTPWFAAGGAGAANLVLNPVAGAAPPVADLMTLDLKLVRGALDCGLPACLESAAADVRSPALKEELTLRAGSLRRAVRGAAAAAPLRAGPPPAFDLKPYPAAVAGYVQAQRGRPEGWLLIADRFMGGREGFPKDEAAAIRWYRAAAEAGSGEAAFAVGSAYHRGAAGVPANPAEAFRWFRRSAEAGHPQAFGLIGQYLIEGLGGQAKSDVEAVRWLKQGQERGDAVSMRLLGDLASSNRGGLTAGPAGGEILNAEAYWQAAAEAGDPEAMMQVANFMLFTQDRPGPGIRGTLEQSAALTRRAAELGLLRAYGAVALNYHLGRGVTKNDAEALRWMLLAAERGSEGSMYDIGMAYATGDYGLAKDCHQAGRWLRRAQVAGSRNASLEMFSGAKKCESYL